MLKFMFYVQVPILQAAGACCGRVSVSTKTDPLANWHAKNRNQHALGTKPLPPSLPRSHNNTKHNTYTPFFYPSSSSFPSSLPQPPPSSPSILLASPFVIASTRLITSRSLCPARFSCFRLRRSSYRVFSRRYHLRLVKTRTQHQDSIIG